jgi:hypothetical protein
VSRRKALVYLGSSLLGLGFSFLLSGGWLLVKHRSAKNIKMKLVQNPVDFVDKIEILKKKAPSKHSNQYQPPTRNELQTFSDLANALLSQNLEKAQKLAIDVGYKLVKWHDRASQQTLLGSIEESDGKHFSRGWGSYFINPSAQNNIFIESPHILFDRFTPEIAAKVFLLSGARGFLMAGAHRHANGTGTADVCDPIASVFQEVHKAWSRKGAKIWQIHGFADPTAKGFPETTKVVLSTGTGEVFQQVVRLEELLESRGYTSYVYNELSANHALNQKLNGELAGTTFSPLAATENVQGIYSNEIGANFLHIEIDSSIRFNQKKRERFARAIADSIRNSSGTEIS